MKPCLDCGRLSAKARCEVHERQRERNRKPRPTNLTRDTQERQRRAEAVADHRRQFGEWCPGWIERTPHQVLPPNILTADHDTAVGSGGDPRGPLVVRCRVCNGAKSDR